MSDLIDRQAAIEAIQEDADWLAAQGSDWQVERMERDKSILESLPAAEPEVTRCKDCKYWGERGLCDKWDYYISNGDFYCGCAERGNR